VCNVENRNIKLPSELLDKLKKNKKSVKFLALRTKSLKNKRKLLVKGKFLPQLLGVIATTVASEFFQNLLKKKE
jgi:hypothetical protein